MEYATTDTLCNRPVSSQSTNVMTDRESECLNRTNTEEVEVTDEDVSPGISINRNRRRHHRRGKRNRHRKQTASEEVSKIGNICAEPSKGPLDEDSKYETQQTKELNTPNKFDMEKSWKSKGGESKRVEDKKDNISKNVTSGDMRKYRHRYHQQRKIKKLCYSSRANCLNRNANGISNCKQMLILRPNRGPLMNAPRNSTQFIINDHEEGENEERQDPSRYQESSPSTLNGRSNRNVKTNWTGDFQPSPDDDTFWADYLERDFQTVYETAHREDVANWHKTKLIEEITHLEKRHKELVNKLSRLDPEIYLRRLQSRVVSMQQRNNMLKSERKTTDGENYNQLDEVQESSEAEPLEEATGKCKQCENHCEVPSQSNIINTEQDTATSTECKTIVSLAPDSTKE